jgi:hypothetical protein
MLGAFSIHLPPDIKHVSYPSVLGIEITIKRYAINAIGFIVKITINNRIEIAVLIDNTFIVCFLFI